MCQFLIPQILVNCENRIGFSLCRASFCFFEPLRTISILSLTVWCSTEVDPSYRLMVVSPIGQPSTLLMYADIARLRFSLSLASFTCPVFWSTQEPARVEGMKVLACPNDKHPFCNSTLFKYDEPLLRVDYE